MKVYRASEADMALACAASVHPEPGEVLVRPTHPAATVGTVVHLIGTEIVEYGDVPDNWYHACWAYGLEPAQTDDVGFQIYAISDFWRKFKDNFGPSPETEVGFKHELTVQPSGETVIISGHMDVIGIPDEAVVGDWKGTREDRDYSGQMQMYAWGTWMSYPYLEKVKTVLVFLRDRTWRVHEWTAKDIREFAARYTREVLQWDGHTYKPGPHCGYCPRWTSCPAQSSMIIQTHRDLVQSEINLPADPDTLIDLYGRVKAVKKRCEDFKAALDARVDQLGSIVGSTHKLEFVDQSQDDIDPQLGWPIFRDYLTDEEIAECLKTRKTAMLKKIREGAPRGEKKARAMEFMDALRDAGAVTVKEKRSLRLLQRKGREEKISE